MVPALPSRLCSVKPSPASPSPRLTQDRVSLELNTVQIPGPPHSLGPSMCHGMQSKRDAHLQEAHHDAAQRVKSRDGAQRAQRAKRPQSAHAARLLATCRYEVGVAAAAVQSTNLLGRQEPKAKSADAPTVQTQRQNLNGGHYHKTCELGKAVPAKTADTQQVWLPPATSTNIYSLSYINSSILSPTPPLSVFSSNSLTHQTSQHRNSPVGDLGSTAAASELNPPAPANTETPRWRSWSPQPTKIQTSTQTQTHPTSTMDRSKRFQGLRRYSFTPPAAMQTSTTSAVKAKLMDISAGERQQGSNQAEQHSGWGCEGWGNTG